MILAPIQRRSLKPTFISHHRMVWMSSSKRLTSITLSTDCFTHLCQSKSSRTKHRLCMIFWEDTGLCIQSIFILSVAQIRNLLFVSCSENHRTVTRESKTMSQRPSSVPEFTFWRIHTFVLATSFGTLCSYWHPTHLTWLYLPASPSLQRSDAAKQNTPSPSSACWSWMWQKGFAPLSRGSGSE